MSISTILKWLGLSVAISISINLLFRTNVIGMLFIIGFWVIGIIVYRKRKNIAEWLESKNSNEYVKNPAQVKARNKNTEDTIHGGTPLTYDEEASWRDITSDISNDVYDPPIKLDNWNIFKRKNKGNNKRK